MTDIPTEASVFGKLTWRVLPILFICYFVAYLDRVNVSFAKLQMLGDLHLSDAAYGVGAGIFFLGYCLFELPSNMILHRVGARIWIARIMLTWGVLSIAMAWVQGETSFYVLRFLLGVAEAGFYPGVLLYLSKWFPASRRGRIMALFMIGNPMSGIIGGPLSGLIMQALGGTGGFASWQWLFIAEGVPALLMAVVVFTRLNDRVEDARFLSSDELSVVQGALAREAKAKTHQTFRSAFTRAGLATVLGLFRHQHRLQHAGLLAADHHQEFLRRQHPADDRAAVLDPLYGGIGSRAARGSQRRSFP